MAARSASGSSVRGKSIVNKLQKNLKTNTYERNRTDAEQAGVSWVIAICLF